jgi:hypothetical protein
MPWLPKDAAAHNAKLKGKPALQKLWANTANGVLRTEIKKGTEKSTAEGIAIATANKITSKKAKAKARSLVADDTEDAETENKEPLNHRYGKPPKPAARKLRTVTPAPKVARTHDAVLRVRLGEISPASIDEEHNSVEAVLGTESACLSMDLRTKKSYLEVYRMDGAVLPPQVPLCDTHTRDSVKKVLGSVRDIRTEGDQCLGRLYTAGTEYDTWSKIRDKHITDVSWGVQPLESVEIPAGKSKEVKGRLYTAPSDRSLTVHTEWRLREVSVTPIGSDERAKIRSLLLGESTVNETLRAWLEANLQLRAEATPEEAQTFWDALSDADRARADEACRSDDEEDDDEEDDEEDEEEDKPAKKPAKGRTAEEDERIRSEATAEGRSAERRRVAAIRKAAASDIPAEIVARAIDEGWTVKRFRGVALETLRQNRSPSVGGGGNVDSVELTRELSGSFGIQSRNHEADCTIATLGAALFGRSWKGKSDPVDILGGYRPSESLLDEKGQRESGQTFTIRGDVTRILSGHTRTASTERRKAAERLLEMGDRYRGMSLMDIVDEANRIEGRTRVSYDQEERIRAAMSGSALSAIFTQNVSAQFLGGYIDAEDTTQGWCSESDVPNFLQNERAIYGKMGQMKRLGKGGTAEDLDTSDWNEVYKIFRYAGHFAVDEQDFINDRFGAIEQMSPMDMGLSARQIRGNLVYAQLLSNPTLNQDGYAVFNSSTVGNRTQINLVTGGPITDFNAATPAVNAGPLQDGTSAMYKQRLRNRVLNLRPRYVVAGTDLMWALDVLYKSQQRIIASGSGGTFNPLASEGANVEVRLDSRLDPLGVYDNNSGMTYFPYANTINSQLRSGTAFLIARPGEQGAKTIEVGYRIGTGRAPRIRSSVMREGEGRYGFQWDANLDIGVKILDYRGIICLTSGYSQAAATGPT